MKKEIRSLRDMVFKEYTVIQENIYLLYVNKSFNVEIEQGSLAKTHYGWTVFQDSEGKITHDLGEPLRFSRGHVWVESEDDIGKALDILEEHFNHVIEKARMSIDSGTKSIKSIKEYRDARRCEELRGVDKHGYEHGGGEQRLIKYNHSMHRRI